MNFGQALELLKSGHRVARAGWNGKNMFIVMRKGSIDKLPSERETSYEGVASQLFDYSQARGITLPCLTMVTPSGSVVVGWLASQTDMLAEDWKVLS